MHDLSNISYEEWLDFVFDHPVTDILFAWHNDEAWGYTCPEVMAVSYMTRMFKSSAGLTEKYTIGQIDQGLWFIPGPNGFLRFVVSDAVQFQQKKECIEAIGSLFDDLLCKNANLNVAGYMWWDSVFTYCAFKKNSLSRETEVLSVVASTIANMLQHGCALARRSAVHGIEHILAMYRGVRTEAIEQIILKNFDLSALGMALQIEDPSYSKSDIERMQSIIDEFVHEIRNARAARKSKDAK
ncbi:MAG: hypothetical protein GC185_08800 [Alphaproteobacteria bacterium]|nr:hypothetical protein [Alphaproteobacteria bacterium]